MIKKIVKLIFRISLSLLLLGAMVVFAAHTQSGSRLLFSLSTYFIPGQIQYQQFAGLLSHEFVIENMDYKRQSLQVTAKKIHVVWSAWDLLFSKQPFQELTGNQVSIHSAAQANLNNWQVNTLYLTFNKKQQLHLQLDSNRGVIEALGTVNHLEKQWQWQMQAWVKKFDAKIINTQLTSDIALHLRCAGIWNGALKELRLHLQDVRGQFQQYPVSGFADIRYQDAELMIEPSQLHIGNAAFTMHGALKKEWDLAWQLQIPSLQNLLKQGSGRISSAGKIIGNREHPILQAQLNAEQIHLPNLQFAHLQAKLATDAKWQVKLDSILNKLQINDYVLPRLQLTANGQYLQKQLKTTFNLAAPDSNHIYGNMNLAPMSSTGKWQGHIFIKLPQLQKLITVTPLKHLQGSLMGEMDVAGTLQAPQVKGQLTLADGRLQVLATKALFSNIAINSQINYPQFIRFSGTFNAGKGNGEIAGSADLQSTNYPINLDIKGKDLHIVDLNQYQIDVTPNVQLTYAKDKLSLAGEVFIPRASIKPKDFSNTVTLPSEVEFVDKKDMQANLLPNLNLNLKIKLGDKIELAYQHLKTKLTGALEIQQSAPRPAYAIGNLYIKEGSYTIFSNELTLQSGRIIYTGNELTDPGLDIKAGKEITIANFEGEGQFDNNKKISPVYTGEKKITVGVSVKGTVNHPNISFYSSQAGLSQKDILSYLILGHPQSASGKELTSAGGITLLNSIIGEMNLGGNAASSTDKLKKMLGLAEITIDSANVYDPEKNNVEKTPTVNVSKKIGHNLSIRYRVGVFKQLQILNLKYQISKRLALQSEASDTDSGADLLYEFEKD